MAYKELSNIYDGYWLIFSRLYKKFIKMAQGKHHIKMDKILDIGCGTGSLVFMLSNKTNEITGLDISESMLQKARLKLVEGQQIEFQQGDFRNFNLNKKYDLILCCYDSLNHIEKLEDLDPIFKCVKEHIEKKGFFIFDIVNERYFINATNESIENYNYDKVKYSNKISYDKERRIFKSAFDFENSKDEHEEIPIEFNEITKYIEKYNFEIKDIFSDFYFNEIDDKTERYYFILKNND